MRAHEAGCSIRVIVDGAEGIEPAELDVVMRRMLIAAKAVVPPAQQPYLGNALLNLAVRQLLDEHGVQNTCTTLIRLVDAVLEHDERGSRHTANGSHSAPERKA